GRLQQLLDAVVWEVGGETDWVPLSQPATVEPIQNGFVLTFNSFPGADLAPLAGAGLPTPRLSRWLRGRLTQLTTEFLSPENAILDGFKVDSLQAEVLQQTAGGIPPDQVHVNAAPVDSSKDFRPLGDNPKVGDTFSL